MKFSPDIMQDASEIVHYDKPGVPLYIRKGRLSSYPGMRALCHWHDDIEFIRVLEGEMNYYINGETIQISQNDGLIVNSRQMHYGYSVNSRECTFICVLFHPSFLSASKLLYQTYVHPVIESQSLSYFYLDSRIHSDLPFLDTITKLSSLKKEAAPCYELEAAALLYTLWTELYRKKALNRLSVREPINQDIQIQKNMVSYIIQHYSEKLTLSDIASAGNVCRSKCCKIFRYYLRQTPNDFLNTYRLKVSAGLLTSTSLSVTEIALSCGFSHPSYYTELFNRTYALTPTAYRNRHQPLPSQATKKPSKD